jgi:ribonucleotide monophosphatase NagD (HAD superfamily)
MIGDDVRDDIGGSQDVGIQGILVKTGKYSPEDEANFGVTPRFVANNFAEAVEYILSLSD